MMSSDATPPASSSQLQKEGGQERPAKGGLGLLDALSNLLHHWTGDAGEHKPKHRHRDNLQKTAEIIQELSDAMASELALLDEDGIVVMVNDTWVAELPSTSGAGSHNWLGLSFWELLQALDPHADHHRLGMQIEALLSGRLRRFTYRYTTNTRDGARRWQLWISAVGTSSPAHFVVVHEELGPELSSHNEAHLHTASTLLAQEEARQRIAMELHDSTSQHLVALGLGMARLRRITGEEFAHDVLADMTQSVNEMVKEIRVLSYLLKPPELERAGLAGAVRNFVSGFGARTGLATEFHTEGDVDSSPPAVRHATFRLVQEALSNVYRHAGASSAVVRLDRDQDFLRISVQDDGAGITAVKSGEGDRMKVGVGISGMRTRVAELGGRFELTCPDRGVKIVAELPATPPEPNPV